MASALGLIRIGSADEAMEALEAEDIDELESIEDDPWEMATELAKYIMMCWEEARDHKRKEQNRFVEAMYARQGRYTPGKLHEIRRTGASEEYARIVANKGRILESWLKDIFLASDERPWTISAT